MIDDFDSSCKQVRDSLRYKNMQIQFPVLSYILATRTGGFPHIVAY